MNRMHFSPTQPHLSANQSDPQARPSETNWETPTPTNLVRKAYLLMSWPRGRPLSRPSPTPCHCSVRSQRTKCSPTSLWREASTRPSSRTSCTRPWRASEPAKTLRSERWCWSLTTLASTTKRRSSRLLPTSRPSCSSQLSTRPGCSQLSTSLGCWRRGWGRRPQAPGKRLSLFRPSCREDLLKAFFKHTS